MGKIVLLILLAISANADYKVLKQYIINNGKVSNSFVYDYVIQSVCKDGYKYTLAYNSSAISVTQDFIKVGINATPIGCKDEE